MIALYAAKCSARAENRFTDLQLPERADFGALNRRRDDKMERAGLVVRWSLAGLAGAIVGYCVLVMVVVATSPDLRMRFMLVGPAETTTGIVIEQTNGVIAKGDQPGPSPQDVLLEIHGIPISTSIDFMRAQSAIRIRESTNDDDSIPPNLADSANWVPVKFRRHTDGKILTTELKVQSVPLREVSLTLVWFVLELLIFSVGAVAFWNRPFDDSARLFFAMCTVTLAAFVGGFHWWTVGSTFWLNLPFAVCGILLPAVILHFFLVYPRPKPPFTMWPKSVIVAIYAIPFATIVLFLVIDGFVWYLTTWTDRKANFEVKLLLLNWLRTGIYSYICVGASYFALALVALTHSSLTTRNPVERNQVRWILRAGCAASFFIGHCLYLAFFHREDFALGGGRLSMFLASLVFMVAYAVGIVRYKLMLIDQIVNRGMSYYVLSYGATAMVAFSIAYGAMTLTVRKSQALEQQPWIIAGILMLAVILLIWVRDSWQKFVDRRFFREKYRLDKTLQRMNQAVGRLADVDFLSERMLTSCRDVLQSELAALYLRDVGTPNFRLAGRGRRFRRTSFAVHGARRVLPGAASRSHSSTRDVWIARQHDTHSKSVATREGGSRSRLGNQWRSHRRCCAGQ